MSTAAGPTVSPASLQADLLNAQQRCTRLTARVQQLKERDQDLAAPRAANRELMARINAPTPPGLNTRRDCLHLSCYAQ